MQKWKFDDVRLQYSISQKMWEIGEAPWYDGIPLQISSSGQENTCRVKDFKPNLKQIGQKYIVINVN